MKAIIHGKILMPDGMIEGKALLFDTAIQGVVNMGDIPEGAETIDAKGMYVSPGLVDIHIHGYLGEDASDGNAEGIRKMARGIVKNGVTSWCPTTMTIPEDDLVRAFTLLRELRAESQKPGFMGAEILGVHAEGPFINESKKGAQKADNIIMPDAALIKPFADIIRMITIAPEVEGATSFIQEITKETNILISMGHTEATYEIAIDAIWHGLGHVTHTFNAMTPLSHRTPGAAGAALTAPVTAELIADTFHVHPGLFSLLAKAKGDRLVLVTDCTRAGGLADGVYDLGGQDIYVKGIECRLADGTIAGSVLKLNNAVANVRAHTDLPLHEVVNMASRTPAAAIGAAEKGTLETGKDADIILCDEAFAVKRTIIRGETVYTA